MLSLLNRIVAYVAALPADKFRHVAVSALLACLALLVTPSFGHPLLPLFVSVATVTAVGLWKEFRHDAAPDPWDLAANYAGAATVWVAYIIG